MTCSDTFDIESKRCWNYFGTLTNVVEAEASCGERGGSGFCKSMRERRTS